MRTGSPSDRRRRLARAFESVFLDAVRLVRDLSPVIADGGVIALVLATSAKEAAPVVPIFERTEGVYSASIGHVPGAGLGINVGILTISINNHSRFGFRHISST